MDLRRLQVFTKVYECRSFSRAAEEVLLSQPTVSGHIKTLEEEIGVNLFDRLGREIMPTRAAELLYGYAQRILAMVDEASMAVDAFLGRLTGALNVGGSTIPAHYVLPAMVGRFRLLHPEVRVTVEVADTGEICRRVLAGALEAAMVGAPTDEERLSCSPLMDDEVSLAVWPGHPMAGRRIGLKELENIPLIVREPGSGTRSFVETALTKAGARLDRLTVAAQMGSTLGVIMGVRAEVGAGFVSRVAMAEEMAAGRLAEIELDGVALKRSFYLTARKGRTHSPAAQAFMALCLAHDDGRQAA